MTALTITVAGTPAPQGSKSPVRNKHTGRINMVEASKRLPTWRDDVRDAAVRAVDEQASSNEMVAALAMLWDAPLAIGIQFVLLRPKSHYRTGRNADLLRDQAPARPAGKPDLDKLVRAILDALTGIVWRDDAQVVHIEAYKVYGPRPGADITVMESS